MPASQPKHFFVAPVDNSVLTMVVSKLIHFTYSIIPHDTNVSLTAEAITSHVPDWSLEQRVTGQYICLKK